MNQTMLAMQIRSRRVIIGMTILLCLVMLFVPTVKITLDSYLLQEGDLYVYASPFSLLTEQEVQVRTAYDEELEELGISKKDLKDLLGKTTVKLPEDEGNGLTFSKLAVPMLLMIFAVLAFGLGSRVKTNLDLRKNELTRNSYATITSVKKMCKIPEEQAQAVCCAYAKLVGVLDESIGMLFSIMTMLVSVFSLQHYSKLALRTVNGVYDMERAIGYFASSAVAVVLWIVLTGLEVSRQKKIYKTLVQMHAAGEL